MRKRDAQPFEGVSEGGGRGLSRVAMAPRGADQSPADVVMLAEHGYEPNWLVESVDDAVELFRSNGAQIIGEPLDSPVGRLGVVLDPFGNALVLLDLSKGTYTTDETGDVTGVSN